MKKVILIFVTIVLSGLLYAKIIRVPMRYFVRLMVSLKTVRPMERKRRRVSLT